MSLILKYARIADHFHKGQTRKDGKTPYIEHPARVASMVSRDPYATEEMVAAAWCHDVLEDTGASAVHDFTDYAVRSLVLELTNTSKVDLPPGTSRKTRKEYDIARLAKVSPEAKLIKIYDRLDNVRDTRVVYSPKDQLEFAKVYLDESRVLLSVLRAGSGNNHSLGRAGAILEEEIRQKSFDLEEFLGLKERFAPGPGVKVA